jgi:hypothetical protein
VPINEITLHALNADGFKRAGEDCYRKAVYHNGYILSLTVEKDDDGWRGVALCDNFDIREYWHEKSGQHVIDWLDTQVEKFEAAA